MIKPACQLQPAAGDSLSRGRLDYLDTYRGIACLLVYFYHTAVNITIFGVPFPGYNGVHLFFVLSGYLMSGKFIPCLLGTAETPDLREYILRRFLRIYPPYFIALCVFVALRFVGHTNPPGWLHLVACAGLVFNYFDRFDFFAINGTFWSLAIEIQFYLVLPLIFLAVLRTLPASRARVFWFALIFVSVGIASRAFEAQFINHIDPRAIAHIRFKWITSYLDLFGAGILLRAVESALSPSEPSISARKGICGIVLGILGLGAIAVWELNAGNWLQSASLPFTAFGPTLTALGFAVILGATGMSGLRSNAFFRWGWLRWVGRISYSVYLYHVGVLFMFNRFFKPARWGYSWDVMVLIIGICCLPLVLIIGWLMNKYVEVPFYEMRASFRGQAGRINEPIAPLMAQNM
jgi:peptidoglycan/LPS O-acetylase OafA/YrhL